MCDLAKPSGLTPTVGEKWANNANDDPSHCIGIKTKMVTVTSENREEFNQRELAKRAIRASSGVPTPKEPDLLDKTRYAFRDADRHRTKARQAKDEGNDEAHSYFSNESAKSFEMGMKHQTDYLKMQKKLATQIKRSATMATKD